MKSLFFAFACFFTFSLSSIFAQDMDINININDPYQQQDRSTQKAATQKPLISAQLSGDQIILGDGRTLTISYKKLGLPWPQLEMLEPAGAKVVLSYDQQVKLTTEVPFLWKEAEIDKYVKIEVEEYDKVWSVKLMPKKEHATVIGTGSAAPAATTSGVWVKTNKSSYNAGESITIEYGGFPGGGYDWVTVIAKTEADDEWGAWQYVKGSGTIVVEAPEAGSYEVRGYFNSGHVVKARVPFSVR